MAVAKTGRLARDAFDDRVLTVWEIKTRLGNAPHVDGHIEHLRQKPSPLDPVPVRAAAILVVIAILINDRQLDRLGTN